jgi:uncharacterized protein (DUF2141 family)
MIILKHTHWLIYSIFFLACARQTAPTGGPKDTIPPTLIASIPKQGQVNFKGKTIELTFSETVILNNPKEQLIITPTLGKDFSFKTKKNQVIFTFEDELQDSTTYAINFRDAVQDITEKNPAQRLKLAFSTGSYVDSLSIDGTAYDLLKNADSKDATVALYQLDTFDIFKHKPIYVTKSDSKGKFKIENLKPGIYFLYGMEDKNKNLIADSKSEAYGFLRDTIQLTENIKDVRLPFVHLDARPLKLTSARPYGTYFNIKTGKNLTSYKITTAEDEHIISSFAEDQANIRIYNTFEGKDSVSAHFAARDSINNFIDTTLYVKFSNRDVKPEPFELSLDRFNVIGTKAIIQGQIKFTKPVLQVNYDSIFYRIDSAQNISFAQQDLKWDSIRNVLLFEKTFDKNLLPKEPLPDSNGGLPKRIPRTSQGKNPIKPSIENQLYLGKGAFISIELDSSKKIVERLPPSKLEDTGMILIEIQTKAKHFFVELLTRDFQPIDLKHDAKKFNFEDLKPGDYQIRLVIDENNDGKWSPGNFYLREEPEPVIFYKNEKGVPLVNLKANWELGPLLITH